MDERNDKSQCCEETALLEEAQKEYLDINHPERYNKGEVECIKAIASATSDLVGIEAVCVGNAMKYLWRWKDKEQTKSLKKAIWYIEHLIKHLEKEQENG